MTAETGFVRVDPALPGKTDSGTQVLVTELAADRLHIRCPRNQPPVGNPDLRIAMGTERSYQLSDISWQPLGNGDWEVHAPSAKSQIAIRDLLAFVRKDQHVSICRDRDVEARSRDTGFDDLELRPCALPQLTMAELRTTTQLFHREFSAPILITGMTGGFAQGALINRRLAAAAAATGIPMGIGSQRLALEQPEHGAIFKVKDDFPQLFLIGNIGIAQLNGSKQQAIDCCRRAIDMVDADALAIHLNVLQEVIQIEGDRNFKGAIERIADICTTLPVPVIIKEVGSGIDRWTARQLATCGATAIDCGGRGGTSWSFIEGQRTEDWVTQEVASTFRDWGLPTAYSLAMTHREVRTELDVIATGGIRDGLMVAKAVALGASCCGIGLPLFRAALESEEAVMRMLEKYLRELKTAMICTGSRTLTQLQRCLIRTPQFLDRLACYDLPAFWEPTSGHRETCRDDSRIAATHRRHS